jgi:hypothetical protein
MPNSHRSLKVTVEQHFQGKKYKLYRYDTFLRLLYSEKQSIMMLS